MKTCDFCGELEHADTGTPSCPGLLKWANDYDKAWRQFKDAGCPGYDTLPISPPLTPHNADDWAKGLARQAKSKPKGKERE